MDDKLIGLLRVVAQTQVSLLKQNQLLSNDECKSELKKILYSNVGSIADDYLDGLVDEALKPYTTTKIASEAAIVPKNIFPWALIHDFPSNESSRTYWKAYEISLKRYMHFDDEQVLELKNDSLAIVNHLMSPKVKFDKKDKFRFIKKGLVYGNVQSGKTATFGGVIAQYVSMGCRIVIVLSGIYNNLRDQTLNRLRRDLGIDNPPIPNMKWHLITNPSDLLADNCQKIDSILSGEGTVVFGVFKKQSQVLKRLNENFLGINNKSYLSNYQALIIDDECDQASINVADISEDERSKINEQIIEMFKKFPRYSYIGFTATPYANVLNEPPGEYSLYPSDFIVALPEKEDYFGASKIFGLGEEFEEYDQGLRTLNIVNTYNNETRRKHVVLGFTELKLLVDAIRYFLLATICKYWRAKTLNPPNERLLSHSTMMIHCSHRIADQREILGNITDIFTKIKEEYFTERKLSYGLFRAIWNKEYVQKLEDNKGAIEDQFSKGTLDFLIEPDFDVLFKNLDTIFSRVELKIDNGQATELERLNYDDENPAVYIAVGGNTLSRGLTLEGLVVSFFSRSTKNFDSLMQMGRWFGYRKGYEDLPRLWMPINTMINFQFLAGVDVDLRESIKRYELDTTPRQVALAIRTNPHMQIVRKMAMQGAVQASINYAGHRPQTIYFSTETAWLQRNIDASVKLVNSSVSNYSRQIGNNYIFEDISFEDLDSFMTEYQFHENSLGLDKDLLRSFISKARAKGYLTKWNLVLYSVAGQKGDCELFEPLFNHPVNYLNRGQIIDVEGRVNLKAITSRGDILCDTEIDGSKFSNESQFQERNDYFISRGEDVPGLLILYPIYKKSTATSGDRYDLNLEADIIGVAFVFPKLQDNSALADSVVVALPSFDSLEGELDDQD
ncbi:MAG: Z1 domain-containing protein [Sphaerochaeta sp.]|nr:Z1 domain-containing protein [Sphaerochaeta sp.]